MAKAKSMKPGGGGRFSKGVKALEKKGYGKDRSKAIMAAAGRKKYGEKKMSAFARAGKARAGRKG